MRQFDKFPETSVCPVCGTNDDKPCVLIPIDYTQKDGICEARPVHVECIDADNMRFNDDVGVIYIAANHTAPDGVKGDETLLRECEEWIRDIATCYVLQLADRGNAEALLTRLRERGV
jgi:hypothetical protein